jgi:hypothetical protein
MQKDAFRQSQTCKINNICYKSLSQAEKILKLNHKTVKNRIFFMSKIPKLCICI